MSCLLKDDKPKLWQLLEDPSFSSHDAYASPPLLEQLGYAAESFSELTAYTHWLDEQTPLADHACFTAWGQLDASVKTLYINEQFLLIDLAKRYGYSDTDDHDDHT